MTSFIISSTIYIKNNLKLYGLFDKVIDETKFLKDINQYCPSPIVLYQTDKNVDINLFKDFKISENWISGISLEEILCKILTECKECVETCKLYEGKCVKTDKVCEDTKKKKHKNKIKFKYECSNIEEECQICKILDSDDYNMKVLDIDSDDEFIENKKLKILNKMLKRKGFKKVESIEHDC